MLEMARADRNAIVPYLPIVGRLELGSISSGSVDGLIDSPPDHNGPVWFAKRAVTGWSEPTLLEGCVDRDY